MTIMSTIPPTIPPTAAHVAVDDEDFLDGAVVMPPCVVVCGVLVGVAWLDVGLAEVAGAERDVVVDFTVAAEMQ